jgi:hypothetical protein
MEEADYSYYDYQYSDWDLDTVDLHFVSGRNSCDRAMVGVNTGACRP